MGAIAFRLLAASLCVAVATASVGFGNCTRSFPLDFIPDQPPGGQAICRDGAIAISYDVSMIDPAWSAYYITYEEASNEISGRLDFYADPDLKSLGIAQAPVDSDAFNTSWNRGHLAPSHINSYTKDTKKATYTMANIAPQEAIFNQQSWQKLENDVINWVLSTRSSLHIITGVAYKSRGNARRTYNNIAVPDYYFKVICDIDNRRSAGFFGDNNVGGKIDRFHTVYDVESIYGGRLFPEERCDTHHVNPTQWWTF